MQGRSVFMHQINTFPDRGARVAGWVTGLLASTGMSPGEFAHRIGADKRDIQRLLADRSCGHRLEDKIAAAFKWDFVEAVMSPVCGGDPITVRESLLAERMAEAAEIHDQIQRERRVRADLLVRDRGRIGARRAGGLPHASPSRGSGSLGPPTPAQF